MKQRPSDSRYGLAWHPPITGIIFNGFVVFYLSPCRVAAAMLCIRFRIRRVAVGELLAQGRRSFTERKIANNLSVIRCCVVECGRGVVVVVSWLVFQLAYTKLGWFVAGESLESRS